MVGFLTGLHCEQHAQKKNRHGGARRTCDGIVASSQTEFLPETEAGQNREGARGCPCEVLRRHLLTCSHVRGRCKGLLQSRCRFPPRQPAANCSPQVPYVLTRCNMYSMCSLLLATCFHTPVATCIPCFHHCLPHVLHVHTLVATCIPCATHCLLHLFHGFNAFSSKEQHTLCHQIAKNNIPCATR